MAASSHSSAFATLAVPDLAAAARWYRNVLGFELLLERPGLNGLPILVHLRRALDQDLELMAARAEVPGGANRLGQGVTLTFVVEDDLDALAARAKQTGAQLVEGPINRPGRVREVTLADADGYWVRFLRRLAR